jgi:hypothetical protein
MFNHRDGISVTENQPDKYYDSETPRQRLLRVTKVSDKDFEANRQGLLSPHQLDNLQNQFSSGLIIRGVTLLFMVAMAMAIVPLSILGKTLLQTVIGLACFLFIARLILSFLRPFLKHQTAFYRDIQAGQVNSISGIPQLHIDKSNFIRSIEVSGKTFLISQSLVEVISATEEYIFYYMPQSDMLVAIEPIPAHLGLQSKTK